MPIYDNGYLTAAVTTAGVLGTAYAGYKLYQSKTQTKLPTEWKQVGTLKDLYAYPIKSVGPVVLETAEVTVMGLRQGWLRDRVLMVVDEKNNFITARAYPELLTVHPSVKNSILTLQHADMNILKVNLADVVEFGKQTTAQVWGVSVPVYECGFDANEWFSRLLNRDATSFRLVYYASHKPRMLRPHGNFYNFTKDDTGALPDEVPYHLINEASVEELNTRLQDCQVTHRNFRPNFVLSGAGAYDEDDWKFVKIGDNIFEIIKPCTRCVLTTIDPETGARNNKSEPLETLKSYRKIVDPVERRAAGNSPRMGLQMALRSGVGGTISLHDPIYVA